MTKEVFICEGNMLFAYSNHTESWFRYDEEGATAIVIDQGVVKGYKIIGKGAINETVRPNGRCVAVIVVK